jgi:hypothetical protein
MSLVPTSEPIATGDANFSNVIVVGPILSYTWKHRGCMMKSILLILALLLPTAVFADGYRYSGYYGERHQGISHGHRGGGRYTALRSLRHSAGYRYSSPIHHSHFHSGVVSGPAFNFSAYPTGGNYRHDPSDFEYHSITPGEPVDGVYTWTDTSGTIHFTDTPPGH